MPKTIPRHIAIIMDGNARWAKLNNYSKKDGYQKGIESLERLIKSCIKFNIKIVTVYALSTENVRRKDIGELYKLIRQYIKKIHNINKYKNIDFRLMGDRSTIQKDILNFFQHLENKKNMKKKIIFNLAYNYGSWNELTYCFKKLLYLSKSNKSIYNKINEKIIKKHLYTSELPDPDILIRTGGNKRLSNFLLLQLKYSEIFFLDTLWPDFNENNLYKIIKEYSVRKRTYGL